MLSKNQLQRFAPLCLVMAVAWSGNICLAQLQPVKVKGVVAGVTPQGVVIRDDKGKILLALTSPNRVEDGVRYRGIPEPMIEIISEETSEYLQVGMYVRFSARVQAKRRVVEPVQEVTIIDGSKITTFGVLPDAAQEDDADAKKGEAEDALVVGRITSARRNAITVAFPDGKSIKAGLTRDATVHVKAANLAFIKPGYLVEGEGSLVKVNKFFATRLKITKPAKEAVGVKPAAPQVVIKDKPAAQPPNPAKEDPFQIGKTEDKPGADAKPVKVRGRILKIN